MNMKLRPYKPEDSQIICSWVKDEKTLFQWSADRIGKFPLMGNELNEIYAERNAGLDFFPLTAIDEKENVIGHLFVLIPDANVKTTVRFGFVIVSPEIQGKGYGKKMLEQAIDYSKKELNATRATLGVFANNPKAQTCYEAVGFKPFSKRVINILGVDWECIDMELDLKHEDAQGYGVPAKQPTAGIGG